MTLTRKGMMMIPHLFQSSKKTLLSPPNSFSAYPSPNSPLHSPRTFSPSTVEEDIAHSESVISKWDLKPSSDRNELLKCVKDLRGAMHFLASGKHPDPAGKLQLCQKLMQIAMTRLEKEFYHILSGIRDHPPLHPESVSGQDEISEESSSMWDDLKSIAECMISAGYTKECLRIYLLIRKSIVDEGLYLLGVDHHYRSSPVQRLNPEAIESTIKNWMNAVSVGVKRLFLGEKLLCDHVFSGHDRNRELCFSELVKEGAENLFRFPELVVKNKHMKDRRRIFPLMDLYEALSNLWPEIESMFTSESTRAVKQQAESSLIKVRESVRRTLSEFESGIQKESFVAGGGIHPLTRSVMDYLSSLADYNGILSDIIADSLPESNSKLPESYYESPTTSLGGPSQAVSVRLAWLILVLLCKLDRIAERQYIKDVSLSYLFLANNLQFIIEKVCTTRLRFVLGEDWVYKHVSKAKQYAGSYETMAWNKVFSAIQPSNNFFQEVLSAEEVEQCFLRFNAAFEESYRKQVSWIVPNRKFRDELKVSIARKLVPAYREFYDTYVGMVVSLEGGLVKFGPDDLENYLSDLFCGASESGSWSSSSDSSGGKSVNELLLVNRMS